jgi:hypothetical protein
MWKSSYGFYRTRESVTIKRNKGREETVTETEALSLVDPSNILVTRLSNYGKTNSEYLLLFKESLQFSLLKLLLLLYFTLPGRNQNQDYL